MKIDDIIEILTNIKNKHGNLNIMINFTVINEYGCNNSYTQPIDSVDFGDYYNLKDKSVEVIKFVSLKTDKNIKL